MFGIRHSAPTVLLKYLPCILRSTPHDLQLIVLQHHAWPFLENESMLREASGCSRSIAKQCPSGVLIILWKHKHITIHQRSQFSLIFRIQHILFFENTSQNKPSPMLLLVPQGTSIRSAKPRFGPRIGFRKSGSPTSLPPRITWRNWAVSFRRTWRGFRRCRWAGSQRLFGHQFWRQWGTTRWRGDKACSRNNAR